MKYLAMIAVVMMFAAVPARADHTDTVQPVIAKASADQRAWAQTVAGRIQSALDAEPFSVKDCKDSNCTASAH